MAAESPNRRYFIFMLILGVIAIGLYIGSIVIAMTTPNSPDDFDTIKRALPKIMGMALGGAVASILALISYYIYDVRNTTYFIVFITCLVFGLSVGAVQIVTIGKVGVI